MTRLAAIAAAVCLCGCYRPNLDGNCAISCTASSGCPNGLTCDPNSSLCTPSGTACTGVSDAPLGDDANASDAIVPDAMPEHWVCAQPPPIPTWTGSNFSVVGSFSLISHPTADVVAATFYFATNGDLEQCVLQANLRGADTCSVVLSLSSAQAETAPSLSGDTKTMYFDRDGTAMQSTQAMDGTWLGPAPVALPTALAMDEVGATSASTAYGVRMLMSDGNDLIEASYTVATGWIPVAGTLGRINTTAHEVDPYLSPDGCWMVFASDRSGNHDLYFAVRDVDGTFAAPTALTNINNDVTDDRGPFVANNQILYYTRGTNLEVAEPP